MVGNRYNTVSVYTTAEVFPKGLRKMSEQRPLSRRAIAPKPGPEVEIIRVLPGTNFLGQILSPAVWGVDTHWDGYRTRECTQPIESCVGHVNALPLRWKGYLYVYCTVRKQYCFLELTPFADEQIQKFAPKDTTLRGLMLRAWRAGTKMKSRIFCELTKPANFGDPLPPDRDPEAILRRLWGWSGRA